MEAQMQKILDELRTIKIEIEYIKENMVDVDSILTPEEEIELDESVEEFKKGNTKSFAQIKKEILAEI